MKRTNARALPFVLLAVASLTSLLSPARALATELGIHFESSSVPGSGQPFAPVAADLDGNGTVDLVVTNFGPGTVAIHLGRGDGSFAPPSTIRTGRQPRGIVAADFNEDGKLDLAVVCKGENAVRIHFGTGDGHFRKGGSFRVGMQPFMLEVADLDRDGHLDLVVSNEGERENGHALSVLRGDGSGQFSVQSFASGRYGSDVAVADFNRDGNADVAISTWGTNDVNVHFGRGDATFSGPHSFTYNGHGIYRVLAADLNRDGNPDMVWNDLKRNGLYVLYGDGKGKFPQRQLLVADRGVRHAMAGDFNDDGWPDLVSANTGAGTISVFLSDGKGGFLPTQSFAAGKFPRAIALADFDADGRLDFAVTDLKSNEINVFLNRGAAPLQAVTHELVAQQGQALPLERPSFRFPSGLALDPSERHLLVADQQNNRVARVDIASGSVTTVAGTGEEGYSGDGGTAIAARLKLPNDAIEDTKGNIYIADSGNNRIRRVDAKGIITTVAGTGEVGYGGDGGPATSAKLSYPFALALDRTDRLYIADLGNHRIRVLDPASGIITTFAGTGAPGGSGDGGPASKATFGAVTDLAFDEAGDLFIVDQFNFRIRKITPDGIIVTVAGTGIDGTAGDGGPATAAQLHHPSGVAADRSGNFYIADQDGDRVRKVTSDGIITTLAGHAGKRGYSGDGGPSVDALVFFPSHITVDEAGNIFFTDRFNHIIREIDTAGIIKTVAGEPPEEPAILSPISDSSEIAAQSASEGGTPIGPQAPPQLAWEYEVRTGSDANAPYAVTVDDDGAIYVAGDVGSGSNWRVLRFGPKGREDWHFDFDAGKVEIPKGLTLTPDGQVVAAGAAQSRTGSKALVISLSRLGKENWRYQSEGNAQMLHGIASDPESNLYLAGESESNWQVTSLTSHGKVRWTYSDKHGSANAIDVDGQGGVIAAGSEPLVWRVVKLSAAGDLIWQHRVAARTSGPATAVAHGVRVDSNGNAIVTGAVRAPTLRLRVEKLDTTGKLLWEYLEPTEEGVSVGRAVDIDREGNAVVVGEIGNDWLMLALSPEGKLLWRSTYDGGGGDTNKDQALAVRLSKAGDIVVAGVRHPVPPSFPSLGAVEWRIARYTQPKGK